MKNLIRFGLMLAIVGGIRLRAEPADGLPLSASQRAERLTKIREGLRAAVAAVDQRLARADGSMAIRDLPNTALAKLILGQDPAEAERLVRQEFALQDMDVKSSTYGALPWAIGRGDIHDENAMQFGTQAVGPMLLLFGDRLSAEFKQWLRPHLQAAHAAMKRRVFRTPAYTNIYLMQTVNLILMGQAIGDAAMSADGEAMLDRWIAYTRQAGIHEFDSPTYYACDLNSLGLGYRFAARPQTRSKFKIVLDYFWTDLAANCFGGKLAGPHSRNYDFLRSDGGVDFYLYGEGLRPGLDAGKPDLEKTFSLLNLDRPGYHPGSAILALAGLPERVVRQRWEIAAGTDRYHYLTPEFSIGCASAGYGPQDKLLAVELASTNNLPAISVVADVYDAPYGKLRETDRSGHVKPHHPPLRPVAVQEKGAMLALLDLNPHAVPATNNLATDVLLPARAQQIVLDGQPVSFRKPVTQSARLDSVVGVREGNAGLAIRVFHADGCGGQSPALELKADKTGLRYGAARFVIAHYHGPAIKWTETHARVGLLFIAARCENDAAFEALLKSAAEARIEEHADKAAWSVTARVGKLTLAVDRDAAKSEAIRRRVNGREIGPEALSVNGQDLAARLWQLLPMGKRSAN